MKRIVLLFVLTFVAVSAIAQEVITLNQSTTRITAKQPITGNNGIYLRPSFGMGVANPFMTYNGDGGKHFGVSIAWGILYRFKEKHWVGIGINTSRFEKMYNDKIYQDDYSSTMFPYVEFRMNVKTWGNNSLFVGVRGGVNLSGWRGEREVQPIWPGTTYYNEDGKPYFAFETGMQFKRFDIGLLYESSFAKSRMEGTSQTESIYAYNLLFNIAYNFRIIKLK